MLERFYVWERFISVLFFNFFSQSNILVSNLGHKSWSLLIPELKEKKKKQTSQISQLCCKIESIISKGREQLFICSMHWTRIH